MKLVRHISVEDGLDQGIFPKKQRRPPPGVLQARWNMAHNRGRVDLAWMRGHHSGLYDAYLTLKKNHPRIAEEFRKAVGFNEGGAY